MSNVIAGWILLVVSMVALAMPAVASGADPVATPEIKIVDDLRPGILPGGLAFKPLIADPRWPHFAISYQYYIDDRSLGNVGAVSLGETFTLYRDKIAGAWWEIGVQAGVFAVFDIDAESKDLVNADYFGAAVLGARWDALSAMARAYHQSSHLGDEFLLRNRVNRINLSYEAVDVKLSYEFFGDVLRLYGGGGYLFDQDPSNLKPGSVQWGAEFRSPWRLSRTIRPIAAVDVQNREENDWHADVSLRAGVEFGPLLGERKFQFLLEYFSGHSPNGQFYKHKVDYLGLGAHFHF